MGRYDADGPEAEFEPGSRGRVLRNRLGITSVREIERRESEALLAVTEQMIDETRVDQRFTADDIRRMHSLWLGEIYVWAGEYRQVNMAKGEFMFAAANQVPRLMEEFGRGPLREYTPCRFETVDRRQLTMHMPTYSLSLRGLQVSLEWRAKQIVARKLIPLLRPNLRDFAPISSHLRTRLPIRVVMHSSHS